MNKSNDWKLVTPNQDFVNEIMYDTEVLKSDLCNYNVAYVLVRGNITIGHNLATEVVFKNCASFIKCITKIDGRAIDDAEDLDFVILMYNLLEYSSNYSYTTASLWFHSKDKTTNFNAIIADNTFKSFKYKAKLSGNT